MRGDEQRQQGELPAGSDLNQEDQGCCHRQDPQHAAARAGLLAARLVVSGPGPVMVGVRVALKTQTASSAEPSGSTEAARITLRNGRCSISWPPVPAPTASAITHDAARSASPVARSRLWSAVPR